MRTLRARFLLAAPNASAFPPPGLPEVAVVGRSNSGKSTLINTLVGQRGLARVSNRPGRTRSINFFRVEERFLLVDLPGYGYAAAPRSEQAGWQRLVDSYLGGKRPLRGVVALFDVRRQPDDLDVALVELLQRHRLAWQAVWTKADKLKKSRLGDRVEELDGSLSPPAPGIAFSSKTRLGRDALLEWVEGRTQGTFL
jgi:GTP-binding protein